MVKKTGTRDVHMSASMIIGCSKYTQKDKRDKGRNPRHDKMELMNPGAERKTTNIAMAEVTL